jgi:glycosyltransferase involved in cell wall biosynthesis
MRLLSVHSGNLYGGLERLLVTIVRNRACCPELDLSFALSYEGRISRELQELGAPVYILGAARLRNPLSVRRARRRLTEVLAENRFDAAICQMPWSQYVFGRALQNAGVMQGCWLHDVPGGKHWLQRLARRVPPDFALANSNFTAGHVPLIFPDIPVFTIYPPVEPPAPPAPGEREAIRRQLGIPPEQVVVLQTSRMEPLKGLQVLIAALAQMASDPRWRALIVGGAQRPREARFMARMQSAVRRHRLEQRITFLGEREDARRLLLAADIFVQPNIRPEGFGQVFVEAMYAGLPVVTSALGGAVEILAGDHGLLVPPASPQALADALQRLVQDEHARASYRARGPLRAAQLCSPATQVTRLLSALRLVTHGAERQQGAAQAS